MAKRGKIEAGDKAVSIEKHDHFIREFIESADKEMIVRIIEALNYSETEERLLYIFFYYPELSKKLRHWQLARLIGRQRESVSRCINSVREEL